nr:hypothetical protein [Tanacetum cinerariifolium]
MAEWKMMKNSRLPRGRAFLTQVYAASPRVPKPKTLPAAGNFEIIWVDEMTYPCSSEYSSSSGPKRVVESCWCSTDYLVDLVYYVAASAAAAAAANVIDGGGCGGCRGCGGYPGGRAFLTQMYAASPVTATSAVVVAIDGGGGGCGGGGCGGGGCGGGGGGGD